MTGGPHANGNNVFAPGFEAEGLIVFGGTASARLAQRICDYLQISTGKVKVGRYPDGETLVKVEEDGVKAV